MAAACLERGSLDEAERLCREDLAATPTNLPARMLLGKVLQAAGRLDEAQGAYEAIAKSDPASVDAWLEWAKLLVAGGKNQNAEACLRQALTHLPDSFHIHNDLALSLLSSGNLDGAGLHLQRALEISPQSEIALCNLGIVRKLQGKIDEAIAAYRQAIALNPALPEAHSNLGDVLKECDLDAAGESFRTALRLRPNYPEALDNLGVVLFFKGQLSEALEKFSQALALRPEFLRAMAHKTTTLFLLGRLPEAWELHRHRFEVAGIKTPPHGRFPTPIWNGEPLAGKALLVWTELGLGEEVLQAGMFSDALKAVSRLTIECSPRLETLFKRSFPSVLFIPRTNPARACPVPVNADHQIAGGDLGAVFRNERGHFPRHAGYLVTDPLEVAEFRRKYRGTPRRFVVGISWASTRSSLGKDKTLALAEFAPILRQKDIVFVNLQYAAAPEDVATVAAALGVEIISDDSVDFSGHVDTIAAQVAAMDLVISVSNTTVHIAGALNVPVWNIVPAYNASGMWHWFSDSDESAWYPSMKIIRRTGKTNSATLEKLASELKVAVSAFSGAA